MTKEQRKAFEEQKENVLLQVQMDELKARHWKAQYDTAYYHLKFDEIVPAYQELLEKNRKELGERAAQQAEAFQDLQELQKTTPGLIIAEA